MNGHIITTSVDDIEFEHLWKEITTALIGLGTQKTEIDQVKDAPLSPDEANYNELLKDMNPVKVSAKPSDENNEDDLFKYITHQLNHKKTNNNGDRVFR